MEALRQPARFGIFEVCVCDSVETHIPYTVWSRLVGERWMEGNIIKVAVMAAGMLRERLQSPGYVATRLEYDRFQEWHAATLGIWSSRDSYLAGMVPEACMEISIRRRGAAPESRDLVLHHSATGRFAEEMELTSRSVSAAFAMQKEEFLRLIGRRAAPKPREAEQDHGVSPRK